MVSPDSTKNEFQIPQGEPEATPIQSAPDLSGMALRLAASEDVERAFATDIVQGPTMRLERQRTQEVAFLRVKMQSRHERRDMGVKKGKWNA